MTTPSIERLVAKREAFLRFARARLRDPALAEELLQAAYARATERIAALKDGERAEAWFYQVLRHAAADLLAGRARARREVAPEDAEAELLAEPDQLREIACACVGSLVDTLTPAHARLVRRVDLEGVSVQAAAGEEGITANAASVRLHRARAALRDRLRRSCGACARHACLDCDCGRREARA